MRLEKNELVMLPTNPFLDPEWYLRIPWLIPGWPIPTFRLHLQLSHKDISVYPHICQPAHCLVVDLAKFSALGSGPQIFAASTAFPHLHCPAMPPASVDASFWSNTGAGVGRYTKCYALLASTAPSTSVLPHLPPVKRSGAFPPKHTGRTATANRYTTDTWITLEKHYTNSSDQWHH